MGAMKSGVLFANVKSARWKGDAPVQTGAKDPVIKDVDKPTKLKHSGVIDTGVTRDEARAFGTNKEGDHPDIANFDASKKDSSYTHPNRTKAISCTECGTRTTGGQWGGDSLWYCNKCWDKWGRDAPTDVGTDYESGPEGTVIGSDCEMWSDSE